MEIASLIDAIWWDTQNMEIVDIHRSEKIKTVYVPVGVYFFYFRKVLLLVLKVIPHRWQGSNSDFQNSYFLVSPIIVYCLYFNVAAIFFYSG